MVKRHILVVAAVMATSMVLFSNAAMAQAADSYQVNYFANRNNSTGFDQIVNITNPGLQGSPLSSNEGMLCANIYVFAADQQMTECCACPITADGLLTLSLNSNLTGNPVTSVAPNSGMIKVVSSTSAGTCDPESISAGADSPVVPDLRAWGTHLVQTTPGTLFTTETSFWTAPLSADEANFLPSTCRFIQYLGSGKGLCTCSSW
jgi:hypothetical protein